MGFDVEMVPYCGKTYRVKTRINAFVDEKTGRPKSLKTPAVILEGVWCRGCFSPDRMGCPRSIYSWWREAWLERVDDGAARAPAPGGQSSHSKDAAKENKQPAALHGQPARTQA